MVNELKDKDYTDKKKILDYLRFKAKHSLKEIEKIPERGIRSKKMNNEINVVTNFLLEDVVVLERRI